MKDKILALARDTVETLGFIFVEAKILIGKSSKTLRVVIHKTGADVSMQDCSSASNVMQRRIEIEVPGFSENYGLVVESPGADRKLSSLQEVEIFKDREMRFVLKEPAKHGMKDGLAVGRVQNITGNTLRVLTDGKELEFNWEEIAGVKLYFDMKNYL